MFDAFLKSVLCWLAIYGTLAAQESISSPVSAPPAAPAIDVSPTAPFSVYASSGCSRSFRKIGSYPTVNEARRVASAHSDPKLVWIATGDESLARNLFPSLRNGLQLSGCSVYIAGCRLGWREYVRTETIEEAESILGTLDKTGNTTTLIYHLAKPVTSPTGATAEPIAAKN